MMREALAESVYAYLVLSTVLFVVWVILFAVRANTRREMLWVSLGTMLLGLTEPLFVPEYWNPPTLWDLARRTGFDLESLLFSFAIGGIVFAAYHVIFGVAPSESLAHERSHPRHRHHVLAVVAAPVLFVILAAATTFNPIYVAAIALVGGFLATLYCRPDLWIKMLVSGALFFLLYFVVFALFSPGVPGLRRGGLEPEGGVGAPALGSSPGRADVRLHVRALLVEHVRTPYLAANPLTPRRSKLTDIDRYPVTVAPPGDRRESLGHSHRAFSHVWGLLLPCQEVHLGHTWRPSAAPRPWSSRARSARTRRRSAPGSTRAWRGAGLSSTRHGTPPRSASRVGSAATTWGCPST